MNRVSASDVLSGDVFPRIAMTVDCIVFCFHENELKVLLSRDSSRTDMDVWSLPGHFAGENEELDDVAGLVLQQYTGLEHVWFEQLRTFIRPHPAGRVLTVAYCALVNMKPEQLQSIGSGLKWHSVAHLQQQEFEHKDLLDYSHKWLQKRIQEQPIGFNLLPEKFSLREMQNMYEAVLDIRLDRRNFRKKFFAMDLLVDTGELETEVPHRPGKLYTFDSRKYDDNKRSSAGISFL